MIELTRFVCQVCGHVWFEYYADGAFSRSCPCCQSRRIHEAEEPVYLKEVKEQ